MQGEVKEGGRLGEGSREAGGDGEVRMYRY